MADLTDDEPGPELVTLEGLPVLYHWSPTERRGQINRYGLRPAMRPTVSYDWRPPYVCFAESASWAWALSGLRSEKNGEPGLWDLWQVNVNGLTGQFLDTYDDDHRWHEVRVFERVYKRRVWLAATRTVFSTRH